MCLWAQALAFPACQLPSFPDSPRFHTPPHSEPPDDLAKTPLIRTGVPSVTGRGLPSSFSVKGGTLLASLLWEGEGQSAPSR